MDVDELLDEHSKPNASAQDDAGGRDEIALLKTKIRQLEEDNEQLAAIVHRLKDEAELIQPVPVDHTYSIDQFMLALAARRGRTYGWRIDYAVATETTPGSRRVTTEEMQKWQKDRRVPDWAYTQIAWLVFRVRTSHSCPDWSDTEIKFLIERCVANPHEHNQKLAEQCTEAFGRDINVPSVKGQKHRLGRDGKLPEHRTKE